MNRLDKIKQNKKMIESILTTEIPEIQLIYLFGSYGTSREPDNSDIDLAIFTGKKIPEMLLWKTQQTNV